MRQKNSFVEVRTLIKSNKKMPRSIVKKIQHVRYLMSDRSSLRGARCWPKPWGYDRIYHFHIRKTAGSSLNAAFRSLSSDLSEYEYDFLNRNGWVAHDNYVYVSHNRFLIERGYYFAGDSHIPMHEIDVPANSFTVTILRDPAERVISHYRMLQHWRNKDVRHPARAVEDSFLGDKFSDFLKRIPREHLLRQIYMFSKNFSVDEALENLHKVNFLMLTENYPEHLSCLGMFLGMPLKIFSKGSGRGPVTLSSGDRELLNKAVAPEYRLLELAGPLAGSYREHR